jgi:hypothetical protein
MSSVYLASRGFQGLRGLQRSFHQVGVSRKCAYGYVREHACNVVRLTVLGTADGEGLCSKELL